MSSKHTIIIAIDGRVNNTENPDYSSWRIGLTHMPYTRKQEHENEGKNTKYWEYWQTDSLSDAEDIESYFIHKKGMRSVTREDLSHHVTVYVYIF